MRLQFRTEATFKVIELPIATLLVGGALVLAGVAVGYDTALSSAVSLICERQQPGLGQCVLSQRSWVNEDRDQPIELSSIQRVRLRTKRGRTGQPRASVSLVTRSGDVIVDEDRPSDALWLLFRSGERVEERESLVAQLDAFLRDPSAPLVEHRHDRRLSSAIFALGLFLTGLFVLRRWGAISACTFNNLDEFLRVRSYRVFLPRTIRVPYRALKRIKVSSSLGDRLFGVTVLVREGEPLRLFSRMSTDKDRAENLAAELRDFTGIE